MGAGLLLHNLSTRAEHTSPHLPHMLQIPYSSKPWAYLCCHPHRRLFFELLDRTPWAGQPELWGTALCMRQSCSQRVNARAPLGWVPYPAEAAKLAFTAAGSCAAVAVPRAGWRPDQGSLAEAASMELRRFAAAVKEPEFCVNSFLRDVAASLLA